MTPFTASSPAILSRRFKSSFVLEDRALDAHLGDMRLVKLGAAQRIKGEPGYQRGQKHEESQSPAGQLPAQPASFDHCFGVMSHSFVHICNIRA